MDWLEQLPGVQVEPVPEEERRAVRDGGRGFVVVIPENLAERFDRSKTVRVEIVFDGRESSAERTARRAGQLIRDYGRMTVSQRLILRGVSPEVIQPLQVRTVDVSKDQERMARFLMFTPLLLIMTVFIGGLPIAIDSTAGERERKTLEGLLAKPVPRLAVVEGKWLASATFSAASLLLTCALLLVAVEIAPLERLRVRLEFGVR